MKYILYCLLFFISNSIITEVSANTKLLRYPDIHGDQITFVYGGDIWLVPVSGGLARRVTSHPGLELFPKFSPDGKWIAFTGQYEGDEQVYVIPSTGGEPKRLTAYPAWGPFAARWGYDNQVSGWSPDGKSVLFRSHRKQATIVHSRLYQVSTQGGLPKALPMKKASSGVYSPDGKKILYSPEARDFRTWKRYRGGWAKDLWIFDLESQEARNITNFKGTDRDPIWSNKGIYFVSERDGSMDLYHTDQQGNNLKRLTQLPGDVRWASGDIDGNIVYEYEGELRVYSDTKSTNKKIAIGIQVPHDGTHTRPGYTQVDEFIENIDLSPDGKKVALSARGDIFSAPLEKGIYRNLSNSSTHERLATWSPDGKNIAYISDASGEEQIWLVDEKTGEQRQLTRANGRRYYGLSWSPNTKQLAASDHEGNLYVVDIKSGSSKKIAQLGAWYSQDYSWSPDGEFLAYSAAHDNFLYSIYLWSEKTGSLQVTSELSNEFNPSWHKSGNYLYFLADRSFAPQMGSVEWNYTVNRETVVMGLALNKNAPNPFSFNTGETNERNEGNEGNESNNKPNGSNKLTRLDPNKLGERLFQVPLPADNYYFLSLHNDDILLLSGSAYYMGRKPEHSTRLIRYNINDQKEQLVTDNFAWGDLTQTQLYQDNALQGELPYYVLGFQQGKLTRIDLEGNLERVDTSHIGKTIDPKKEWANVFEETWRRYRDFFYVDTMHGYDWNALGEKYRQLLPHVAHRSDLNYLIGEMIAELNVGHAYTSGGDSFTPERAQATLLGASFKLDPKTKRYQIVDILKGDNSYEAYRSPLTEIGVNISEGDYILAINGNTLNADHNPYELLRRSQSPDQRISLRVAKNAKGKNSRTVTVKSLSSEQPLSYHAWVENNRQQVAKLSKNRIGYLHIPDMGAEGIQAFIRSYYGQIRKDGLIVDVRGNLGGNVSQMILERLLRKPYSLGFVKGEQNTRLYPWGMYGSKVFTGKLAVLADETTLSDGEAFTWTFKQAKVGPVIGRRTWGGVIGTDDTGPTVDGGRMRVPQFAITNLNSQWVVEGHGVVPDIEVSNSPQDSIKGRDRQLERAVQEIIEKNQGSTPGILPKQTPPGPIKTQPQE